MILKIQLTNKCLVTCWVTICIAGRTGTEVKRAVTSKEVKRTLTSKEVMTSFDVKDLFTSVPVFPAIQIVKQRLQQDTTLPQRTSMSIPQITSLLEFCLTNTYFLLQGKYYVQVQGAATGSPLSPLIANIFTEEFEVKALSSIPIPYPMAKVCRWHLCQQQGRTQSGSTTMHQQPRPTYPVHSGTHTTRLTSILRHPSHHGTG